MRLFFSSASPCVRTWIQGPLSLTQVCAARSTRKVACLARFTLAISSGLRRRCNEITPSSVSDQDAGQLPSCRARGSLVLLIVGDGCAVTQDLTACLGIESITRKRLLTQRDQAQNRVSN